MERIISDLNNFVESTNKYYGSELYKDYYRQDKNLVAIYNEKELLKRKQELLKGQRLIDKNIIDEIKKFDSFGIPIIGLKGLFIKELFYNGIDRVYDDIDLLVSSENAYALYKKLYSIGYRIENKTLYDFPHTKMYLFPQKYMDTTQTLMLHNKANGVSIDLHSNLNITNIHLLDYKTKIDTKKLFNHSESYLDFNNIRVLELHDNLCFLFRHLLKHHVFYGKTQMGLSTPIQHILDISLIINSPFFDECFLLSKVLEYNILLEAVFCLNIYNKIFYNCRQIELESYLKYISSNEISQKWFPILKTSLKMNVEDIMIGNFKSNFPKLQKAVEFSRSLPTDIPNWLIQTFIISIFIEKFL